MQKAKLEEFNKLFKETNIINVKQRASELNQRSDIYEKFLGQKK